MTDRYDALAYALAELTTAHKVISNTPDLTTSDLASILGPLGDAISDAEFLLNNEYYNIEGAKAHRVPVDGYATT